MRDTPTNALVVALRELKMFGMAHAVGKLAEDGAPAFEAAQPLLAQLFKAETAEREVRAVTYHLKQARFLVYRDLAGFEFAQQAMLPFNRQWRYAQVSLTHQSNGQSDPLSRSWNRVNFAAGFERGDWSLITRFLRRLKEDAATDNNPDLVGYRGRGEFQLNWVHDKHTAQLLYRTTLRDAKLGALQFEWTYPVFKDQPNGLRWYIQVFRGYGETLTDYNFCQTSVGAGFSFLQF